jgi:signal transduction histidine kinase
MVDEITCPDCGHPIHSDKRYCDHCGVDLAVAAVLAEQKITIPVKLPEGAPIAPEILVPRIGDYMIERGLLKTEDLHHALDYQAERAKTGNSILLGQALLELGLINQEVLDQVITTQILELQTALNEANRSLKQRVEERTTELQKALERLAELNHLKSNFIANISHELRTPLTHIKGYLDILSEGGLGPLTKSQSEALDVIKRAETRLEKLIEDLIQFSLASRGELSLTLQNSQMDKLIRVSVDRSRQKANTRDITLKVILPDNRLPVHVDEDKIGWVLFQLLDNAIKFTPQGGRVEVRAILENGIVTTSIIDTGIGIPSERIPEIFESFHQLDGSMTRRYSGTGLGMAMVRRIIEAHGSQIKVQSIVDRGSHFYFSLPVRQASNKSEISFDEN